jgi:hypothetical protein
LAAIPDQAILAGRTLNVTNVGSDPGAPPQSLIYSLAVAPPGATVGAAHGVFTWRPPITQSPGTQNVAVVVSDNGAPSLAATQAFRIFVQTPVSPQLSSLTTAGDQFGFWISGDSGPDYVVQTSTNLISWTSITTLQSAALPYFWSETGSSSNYFRFYRVLLGP